MAWLDVLQGRQSWSDYISTQDQIQGIEHALESHRSHTQRMISLVVTDHETARAAGLGAICSEIRDVGSTIGYDLRHLTGTIEVGFDKLSAGLEQLGADFNILM